VSRRSLLLRMELESNPDMLSVVRAALGQLTEKLGYPAEECRAVVLAVDEALTNIIRHAYHGHAERPIEASFRRVPAPKNNAHREALEIILEDRGVTVDQKKLRGRALDDVQPGGLGLHFIRESMDTVEFRRRKGRNQLRLVKFLHMPKPNEGS
jgi:serine/threonine-protein kinase RsbW